MDSTKLLIFFFIGFGLTTCSNTYVREYHYVNQPLNWTEAQKYCREKYTDLATIESVEDLSRLNRPSGDNSLSWIGLTDDPKSWKSGVWSNDSNPWRWSATDKPSETGYHNWASVNYEQYRSDLPVCVCFHFNGYWYPCSCSSEYHFVCFNESNPPGQRNYTLITNQLTWIEAQTYCRTHHTDLATIENAQENAEVESMFTNSYAWIGLYRVPWRWSDNSSSSFTNWASGQSGDITQNCVAEDSTHAWYDEPCDRKLFFLCYKDLRVKKMTMVRMKIQTFADLSDPATHAQILQQLSERFKALHGDDVKLRWVTQPTKQEEDDDEDKETCN